MRFVSLALIWMAVLSMKGLAADVPAIADSASPDGNLHAVMDIERDPKIDPEWKEESYPKIEITEKRTGKVVLAIKYTGSPGDDEQPLRKHVSIKWRKDSRAFAVTINDRYYSDSTVYVKDAEGRFVSVKFPGYEEVSGVPVPKSEDLLPRGFQDPG